MNIEMAGGGVVLGLVIKYFWDKWNKPYLTKEDCNQCETKIKTSELCNDVLIIREVSLELAVKNGIEIEKYKGLVR